MASRENQGITAALIVFVMLTIATGTTAYLMYRKAEELRTSEASARTSLQTAQAATRTAADHKNILLSLLGKGTLARVDMDPLVTGDADMTAVLAEFDQHMINWGEGLPTEGRNYISVASHIASAIQQKNNAVTDTKQENQTLHASSAQVKIDEQKRVDAALVAQTAAEKSLMDLRTSFDEQLASFTAQQNTDATTLADLRRTRQTEQAAAQKEVADLRGEVSQQQTALIDAITRLKKGDKQDTDTPDGQITLVNVEGRTVWIDLGGEDGLRVKTTFVVFERGETGLQTAKVKGKIEVLQVAGDHRAECKIVDEPDVGNPILPGDLIYSKIWQRGGRLHVSLAGFMDIDGDKISDRDYIRSLLTLNGGIVDAELFDDGHSEGRISEDTRYHVIGEPGEGDQLKEFQILHSQAVSNNVEEISYKKLLELIGYEPGGRRVTLGPNASVEADKQGIFRPRSPQDSAPPAGAPGAAGTGEGAY